MSKSRDPHDDAFRRLIVAHQTVVERWKDGRPDDIDRLESITRKHTEDALYRPLSMQYEIEREFYDAVDEAVGPRGSEVPPSPDYQLPDAQQHRY